MPSNSRHLRRGQVSRAAWPSGPVRAVSDVPPKARRAGARSSRTACRRQKRRVRRKLLRGPVAASPTGQERPKENDPLPHSCLVDARRHWKTPLHIVDNLHIQDGETREFWHGVPEYPAGNGAGGASSSAGRPQVGDVRRSASSRSGAGRCGIASLPDRFEKFRKDIGEALNEADAVGDHSGRTIGLPTRRRQHDQPPIWRTPWARALKARPS